MRAGAPFVAGELRQPGQDFDVPVIVRRWRFVEGGRVEDQVVGGAFEGDGTIVLVGNVTGPTFDLEAPIKVIGEDAAPPAEPKPVPQMAGNKPKLDKEGKPLFEKTSWRHERAPPPALPARAHRGTWACPR